VVAKLRALPAATGSEVLLMKPGHWYEVQQPAKANFGDESLNVTCNVVDQLFHPLASLGLREPVAFERSIALGRGQEKRLDYQVFLPAIPPAIIDQEKAIKPLVRVNYAPRGIGVSIREEAYPVTVLPDYQYYLIALSKSASPYQFLEGSTALVWPSDGKLEEEKVFPIRLISVEESEASSSLPSRLNTWSSTSHLLWNDCSATALTELQKVAIVDWLHFGGQLIVNGPESQGALANSFLSDYLPLLDVSSSESVAIDWANFNGHWSISKLRGEPGVPIVMPIDRIVPGVQGRLAKEARWVNQCEGIAAERMVGAGRVVMTTFPFAESSWVRWPSYSSFINSVLLGRPPRVWASDANQFGDFVFAEPHRGYEKDPTLTSRFRLLARDLGSRTVFLEPPKETSIRSSMRLPKPELNAIAVESQNAADDAGRARNGERGGRRAVGELTSQGGFTRTAGQILREASGINVPSISTIVKLLAAYLIILVPVNWIVFRIIGRVELAWVAAPIIAVVGAFAVARAVQLDVGFSRSQTSLSIVEIPSGYSRGYVASFTSLYTSLTTNYSALNTEHDGIVVPMSMRDERVLAFNRDSSFTRYRYASDRGDGLDSFAVRSNSTSSIRAEQTCEIGGTLLIGWKESESSIMTVENQTDLILTQVGVIAMDAEGVLKNGWIGDVGSGDLATVAMRIVGDVGDSNDDKFSTDRLIREKMKKALFLPGWAGANLGRLDPPLEPARQAGSVIEMAPLIESIVMNHRWMPGETLMIGLSSRSFDSTVVTPLAPQHQNQSIVMVHGYPKSIGIPSPDINLPAKSNPSLETDNSLAAPSGR